MGTFHFYKEQCSKSAEHGCRHASPRCKGMANGRAEFLDGSEGAVSTGSAPHRHPALCPPPPTSRSSIDGNGSVTDPTCRHNRTAAGPASPVLSGSLRISGKKKKERKKRKGAGGGGGGGGGGPGLWVCQPPSTSGRLLVGPRIFSER